MEDWKLPDGTEVFHLHRGECHFLYEEIFVRRCYAGNGLRFDKNEAGCILDVGANIGMSTLFFHRECPGTRIFAFEPSPKTFAVLSANVRRWGIDAKLYDCALGASPGTAVFTHYPSKSIMSGLFADPEADKQTTKAYLINEGIDAADADDLLDSAFTPERFDCRIETVSSIIDENGIKAIDLLKIDVEKAELHVLRGVRDEHWSLIRQVVAEVHDIDGRVDAVTSMLETHGFTTSVKQDPMLKNTGMYDVIALRS